MSHPCNSPRISSLEKFTTGKSAGPFGGFNGLKIIATKKKNAYSSKLILQFVHREVRFKDNECICMTFHHSVCHIRQVMHSSFFFAPPLWIATFLASSI